MNATRKWSGCPGSLPITCSAWEVRIKPEGDRWVKRPGEKALERVRQAADEMVKAGDVAIEKKERLIRLAPPDWWGNPEGKV